MPPAYDALAGAAYGAEQQGVDAEMQGGPAGAEMQGELAGAEMQGE